MLLTLRENEYCPSVALSFAQLERLRSVAFRTDIKETPSKVLQIEPGNREGEYRIGARDIVGAFSAGDIEVVIEPKCGNAILAHLLTVALPLPKPTSDVVHIGPGSFRDTLAFQFLQYLELATAEGAFESYVRVSSIGARPRGQIDFVKFVSGLQSPVVYRHDLFTSHNPLNSFLTGVLENITNTYGTSNPTGHKAKIWADNLGTLTSLDPMMDFAAAMELAPDETYSTCIRIGALILQGSGLLTTSGETPSHGLLFHMPKVFEGFITSLLAAESTRRGLNYDVQGRKLMRFLDVDRQLRLMPDVCVGDVGGRTPLIVVDAKYKFLGPTPGRADLYQMLAYCDAYGAHVGVLIGLGEGPDTTIRMEKGGLTIRCLRLSLGESPVSLDSKVKSIFGFDLS